MSEMMRFEHGGDIYTHEGVIDFSANINPLGMPERVREALRESVDDFQAYPDLSCRELRAALSRVEGVPADQILCTAGATDLIHRICTALRPRVALVTAPCFSGYEQALEQAGAEIVRHPLYEEDDFNLTDSILQNPLLAAKENCHEPSGYPVVGSVSEVESDECASLAADPSELWSAPWSAQSDSTAASTRSAARQSSGTREAGVPSDSAAASTVMRSVRTAEPESGGTLVFLCSPNNPTGLTIGRELLVGILEAAQRSGAVVVLDECFLVFTCEPSAVSLCERFPNLVVMRAFTKLYAMAGLRLGYGICSDVQIMNRMKAAGQLWAVSTPAQVAGVAALEELGWAQRTREYVDAQREALRKGLLDAGMRVVPGQANYLLFQSPVELYEPLLQRGFLVRRCANYEGLDQSWYRIAVRTADENAAFLAALQEVLA